MKVLFAIKTLTHSVGGAERMVACLSGLLSEQGADTHLLTFDAREDIPFFKVSDAVVQHRVSVTNAATKTNFWEYPILLWRLRQRIMAIRPDVVIAFMHSMFVPVQFALLGSGIKVVLSEHTTPAYYKTRKHEFLLLQFFSLFARRITVVSEAVRSLYPLKMQNKMDILPNPVISDFQSAQHSGSRKIVLSVGRLNKDKDHQILVKAFLKLMEEFPDWDLVIIGDGEERGYLFSLISEANALSRISLPGVRKDVATTYKSADLFIMPSRYESFGLVTAEAMSHALPTIGFQDCPGTNELIEDNVNGLLIQVRSIHALAEGMRRLMGSADMRTCMGQNGRQKVESFSPSIVTEKWSAYLNRIVR